MSLVSKALLLVGSKAHPGFLKNRAIRLAKRASGVPVRKTFAIGFNKTGTRSLDAVFQSLGYLSYHGLDWHDLSNRKLLEQYDCFSDGFPQDWKVLADRYPDAKFILNVRQCRSWIISRLKHIARTKKTGRYSGGSSWGIWDETEEAVVSWIRQWHSHHLDVLEFFGSRPDRLLVVNFVEDADAARKVALFLGFDANAMRPHKGGEYPDKGIHEKYAQLIDAACRTLGLPPDELSNDLLLPSLLPQDQSHYAARARTLGWIAPTCTR